MLEPLKEVEEQQSYSISEMNPTSSPFLSEILENISDGIFSLDSYGRFIYLNSAAEHLLERSRSDLLGASFWTCFPDAAGTPLYDYYLAALTTQTPQTFEWWFSPLGKWFDVRTYPGKNLFTIYLRNITMQKNNEAALRESEEMFRMITENSTDMISRIAMNGTYLYVSAASRTLLGYEPDALVGSSVFDMLHPDDLQFTDGHKEPSLTDLRIDLSAYRIRKKDGTYIWFETTARPILDKRGLNKEVITVSRDITARKHVENQLRETNELLQRISTVDALTGVANRRGFDECLLKEWKQGSRMSTPLSLILVDIDFFKRYNDSYGHIEGDICLQRVAESLRKAAKRPGDFIARYGGEEFVVLLPSTDAAGARTVAEHLRQQVELLQIPHTRSEHSPYITISSGTATMIPSRDMDPSELFLRADKALYQAKQEGRNVVRLYHRDE
ncbi:diguanylate cyclase domain-containing protein [Paenibacillus sp. OAS669]|uniref:sensor domain-containing diguanylate cyclase n=1 Tax=Paenibacillus sp. OAS669 TaxID=2663821 RepID=UPI00178985B7|nr:diguanylate cyclase [Paenibacillus sp. OAS669]MBE1441109.1 diguanylate cyclase (GGDEF)-like protein/PAS domain S-box-containing protein [Paenibacillus sp. OAS669]